MDVSFAHLDAIYLAFNEDHAEHYGYLNELNLLNLSLESNARKAIAKWVVPASKEWSETGRTQILEALRVKMTLGWGHASVSFWRPGIDELENLRAWRAADLLFAFHAWSLLAQEPFAPAVMSEYRQRVDREFVRLPHSPELWVTASYADWIEPLSAPREA